MAYEIQSLVWKTPIINEIIITLIKRFTPMLRGWVKKGKDKIRNKNGGVKK